MRQLHLIVTVEDESLLHTMLHDFEEVFHEKYCRDHKLRLGMITQHGCIRYEVLDGKDVNMTNFTLMENESEII